MSSQSRPRRRANRSSPSKSQPYCAMDALPAEIRLRILKYIVPHGHVFRPEYISPKGSPMIVEDHCDLTEDGCPNRQSRFNPRALTICKQLTNECLDILYGDNVFVWPSVGGSHLIAFFDYIGAHNAERIRHLIITYRREATYEHNDGFEQLIYHTLTHKLYNLDVLRIRGVGKGVWYCGEFVPEPWDEDLDFIRNIIELPMSLYGGRVFCRDQDYCSTSIWRAGSQGWGSRCVSYRWGSVDEVEIDMEQARIENGLGANLSLITSLGHTSEEVTVE